MGDEWAQATSDIWRQLLVLTAVGRYIPAGGTLTDTLDESDQQALDTYLSLQYYYGTHFAYDDED